MKWIYWVDDMIGSSGGGVMVEMKVGWRGSNDDGFWLEEVARSKGL